MGIMHNVVYINDMIKYKLICITSVLFKEIGACPDVANPVVELVDALFERWADASEWHEPIHKAGKEMAKEYERKVKTAVEKVTEKKWNWQEKWKEFCDE